ncbi:gamma-glutamyl-gamma-aminobutyrate hydrolase family protein [Congregibacter variabilis]|uniref:Gamma-glutamyl-gamma-aminobutyrate hydrolase family protein n=1 Tax=Congregibacter variabilis TaxID=3081200 RepID=A0ABZ0HZC1_9GAMM|nr:gamma-glutamyl-gamma-aminobutyrate hydrolase family protein [Congregibacter sp. IMCC43200]
MATRPRIGVTGNGRRWAPSWWCTRLALLLVGARAVRISVRHEPGEESLHALIIGGGDDIGPERYGEASNPKIRSDPARDALEIHWIKRVVDEGVPLLGICRGAQLINVVLGGTLHQDIRDLREHTRNRPGLLPTKTVVLETHSKARTIFGTSKLRVNSLHHQAIKESGETLEIVGRDRDKLCQMIESNDGKLIFGVQWHPEYLFYLPTQLRIFRWLVSQADQGS